MKIQLSVGSGISLNTVVLDQGLKDYGRLKQAEVKSKGLSLKYRFAVTLTAILIGLGAYTADINKGYVVFGAEAVAQEQVQYKTVDDILAPIHNKVFVNKDTYLDAVKKSEKAVVFFYERRKVDGSRGRLARVYNAIMNQFPNIKLICYDMDKEGYDKKVSFN